jgi:hypothetical protein
MLWMLPKQRVWRRSDRVRNLVPRAATFPREAASWFARWYGLGLLLQDERQHSRPILPPAQMSQKAIQPSGSAVACDLTVEAVIHDNQKWHRLFTQEDLAICARRLREYRYLE